MYAGKPIIGIAGGIGSGKSFIAGLFGQLGCLVISADEQIRQAYREDRILRTLRQWWGNAVFDESGKVNRKAIGAIVFANEAQRKRLENLLHPVVSQARIKAMEAAADDAQVLAFVWDIPLLFEVGLHTQCDAIVFVEAPLEQRISRVKQTRGWDAQELARRENLQMPLDNKLRMSNYMLQNTADVGFARRQVENVLNQVLRPNSRNG